jgi:tetratricopeptide (TPR) repeat protein
MRDLAVRVVLLGELLLFSSRPGLGQEEALRELYHQARAAQGAGDYETAIQRYERIVKLRPDMAEAYSNLGTLYYERRQMERAGASFRKAIQLKPELSAPYFFLGVLALNSREHGDALKYLKKSEELGAATAITSLYLGYTQYALSNYQEAAQYFERAAEHEPENSDVFYHLSKAYGQLAKEHFAVLKDSFSDSFYTRLARGHIYEVLKQWDKAGEEYALALSQQPANSRLQERRNWVVRRGSATPPAPLPAGSADELIDGCIRFFYAPPENGAVLAEVKRYQGLVRNPQSRNQTTPRGFYLLAEGYQILSFLASLRVNHIDPDSYRARILRAQYDEELGRDEEAIRQYQEALKSKPDLQNVHFAIGTLYWKRNQLDQALPALKRELEVSPNHPQALYEIGDILYAQGKLEESQKYLLRSLRFEPKMVEAHLAVASIYAGKAQYPMALEHLNKVAGLDPGNPTPHYRMAAIYQKLGQPEQAQREMELFKKLKGGAVPLEASKP